MTCSVADAAEYDGEKHRREKRKELSKKKLVIVCFVLFFCPSVHLAVFFVFCNYVSEEYSGTRSTCTSFNVDIGPELPSRIKWYIYEWYSSTYRIFNIGVTSTGTLLSICS